MSLGPSCPIIDYDGLETLLGANLVGESSKPQDFLGVMGFGPYTQLRMLTKR